MKTYQTEQETFWANDFGDQYIERNRDRNLFGSKVALFSRILGKTDGVKAVMEYGANIGLNLQAIREIIPHAELSAVEINAKAAGCLKRDGVCVFETSLLEFVPPQTYDFVLTKGVLIHIAPDRLKQVYQLLYESSRKYVCVAEYYNPVPVTVAYRGHQNKLFKRDFAGELMDLYPDLELIDYGFVYHRDPNSPMDDISWFLMMKRAS